MSTQEQKYFFKKSTRVQVKVPEYLSKHYFNSMKMYIALTLLPNCEAILCVKRLKAK